MHTVIGAAANMADVTVTAQLLHGEEKTVHADAGYTGAKQREDVSELAIAWPRLLLTFVGRSRREVFYFSCAARAYPVRIICHC